MVLLVKGRRFSDLPDRREMKKNVPKYWSATGNQRNCFATNQEARRQVIITIIQDLYNIKSLLSTLQYLKEIGQIPSIKKYFAGPCF